MNLLVMFDLPTKKKVERKRYTIFRKRLLQDGFEMIQYSVYVRTCKNRAATEKHIKRIKNFLPLHGEVRILLVPENTYSAMFIYSNREESRGESELIQTVMEF